MDYPININEIGNITDLEILREAYLNLHSKFERDRDSSSRRQIELEQELFEIQQQNESFQKNLSESSKGANDLKDQLNILESERSERTRRLYELEGLHDKDESEKAALKRQCDQLSSEKNKYSELVDSKDAEIERKKEESAGLREELRGLISQICEFQVKQGELENRELALEHRENRLKDEHDLIQNEKTWLQNELLERDTALQQVKKEAAKQNLEKETACAAKDEELRETRFALDSAKEQNTRFAEQLEKLTKRMKEAADEQALKEESYEKEMQCQTKLSQVYKQSADEAEAKVEELAASLESVQSLFNEAKEQHFAVQEQMQQVRVEFEKEMKEKDNTIAELRDELEKANELLRSKHRVMLSDEEVAALSPAAAAASKLIRGGTSLTQIYRDHAKVVEELEMQKLENKRIEAYFRELVQEIEAKAPIYRKRQEEYSRSLTTIENMKRQLRDVEKDQQKMLNEKDALLRELTYKRAELQRYQRDNADLSSQVRELLCTIERMRATDLGVAPSPMDSRHQPSAEDLLLFRNIDEMQSKYQQLLSKFREMEAGRDEMVKAAQENEMSKIRTEVDQAMKEVGQLRAEREKLNQLLQAIREERDTYKRLMFQARTDRDVAMEKAKAPVESETLSAKSTFETLRLEFDTYRKEKSETEKILQEKLDKYDSTIIGLRASNTKLNAEVEYQLERFKISSGNAEVYKKEIKGLNDRNERIAGLLAKHEQTVQHLTNEFTSQTEELGRLRLENGRLKEQLQEARNNESAAQRELQTARREQQTQQVVSMTLQEMDARLQRREAEDTIKLRSDLEGVTRERNYLQSNLRTVTEQSQEYIREYKAKIDCLESKIADADRQSDNLREELKQTREQLENEKAKSLEFRTDLEGLQSYPDAPGGRFQAIAQQLQARLNFVETRNTEANKRIEELTQLLNSAQTDVQHYQHMAEALEEEFKVQKEKSQQEREFGENEITSLKQQLENVVALERERREHVEHLQERLKDFQRRNQSIDELSGNLQRQNDKVEELNSSNAQLMSEVDDLKNQVQELQGKCEAGERRLSQARQLALKYRMQSQENEKREAELKAEIESLKEAQEKVELEKKEIEARCNILESRVKEQGPTPPPTSEPGSEYGSSNANQMNELMTQMEEMKKKEEDMKGSLASSGQLLVHVQAENKKLERTVEQLKEEQEKMVQVAEERKFRLDSLTSLHSQCENRSQKLSAETNALSEHVEKLSGEYNALSEQYALLMEQYQSEKASWDKQIQEAKAASRAAPVQLVSAMPTGLIAPPAERPSPGPNHEPRTAPVKPSRQTPVVANVRPQRSAVPIPPTAISPGPSFPDQSSAVSSLPPVPISISPTIISSTQSSTVGVPQAVVPPHIESVHGTVSASSDAFGDISSSSVVISVVDAPVGTSEAASAASLDVEAPSVASKRRPPQDPSDRPTKRSRANSPEQVSTSEQHAHPPMFAPLPVLPEEIVESGASLQEIVGSSFDDQSDEVIFVEEVERGVGEPESSSSISGQHHPSYHQPGGSFDEHQQQQQLQLQHNQQQQLARTMMSSANVPSGGGEVMIEQQGHGQPGGSGGPSGGGGTFQPPPLMSSMWDPAAAALDDGIVPSTPTLVSRRGAEPDVGGAAHVPQGRFPFMFVQEPYPTSHVSIGTTLALPTDVTAAYRSVPSTPRAATPLEGNREAASSSTGVDVSHIGAAAAAADQQQPQPSGQTVEAEIIEPIMGIEEESEESSEAVASSKALVSGGEHEQDDDRAGGPGSGGPGSACGGDGGGQEGAGDEDSNEPTTSQPRSSRIRLNLHRGTAGAAGDETETSGGWTSTMTTTTTSSSTSSEPASSTVGGGAANNNRNTARRGRRGRGRGGRGAGGNYSSE